MLWGLLDAHFYCGNRQALFHLGRITDWAIKNLDRSRRVNDTATEWYTLSENLYRAFLQVDERHWTGLRRPWRDGDVVTLRLPMKLQTSRLDRERPTPVAVLYGPVVLAFEPPSAQVLRDVDLTSLEQVLTPVAGEPLHYRLARNPSVVARPFASFGADRRYFVYLDPEMGRRIPRAIVLSTGGDV